MNVKEKIIALRKLMERENIDAWIVPSSDPHQSEYVAECWRARAWLSGFTGSAGTLVITKHKAGLWTDSRYYIQAEQQLKGSGIKLFKLGKPDVPTYRKWLFDELPKTCTIGFDGKLLSIEQVRNLKKQFDGKNITFFYQKDLVDEIWHDRPPMPSQPIFLLDEDYTGESRKSKFERIREKIKGQGDYHFISALDDIAWTFNIRGSDIAYNPVVISYALISMEDAQLFIDLDKVPDEVKLALENDGVVLVPYNNVFDYLSDLPKGKTILIDPKKTSQKIKDVINSECKIKEVANIPIKLKAIKNDVQLEGFRKALIRDGVAMVKWLFWLEDTIKKEKHTEVTLADKLEEFRSKGKNFMGLSFPSICGYKHNAALPHYQAEAKTALEIEPKGILLMDSGAQYLDGTTDITRTIALGTPTEQEKKAFTLVLKGHIQLASAVFPKGTIGIQLDTLARFALWKDFSNFGHGTGHGVGHFLGVHEGPQNISPKGKTPLEPGMVISNEPALYIEGKFGIRIENLIVVRELRENDFGTFYGFETLTLCPIDINLINADMLLPIEKEWLNNYHKEVYEKLSPYLTDEENKWLRERTTSL